tara:strand:+ start:18044 stop:18508 length:465 start_codon:yes stop_codon:yes gene_type:complete
MKILNKFIFYILTFFFIFISNTFSNEISNFLSLKNDKVNLRQGPSFEYPIKLTYKKKYLPVVVIDRSETWRQIRDHENNFGWIHVSQLSKKKSGINIVNNSVVYKKSTIFSKPIVILEMGRLVLIDKCKNDWCKIKTGGYKGWTLKETLWGKLN